MHGVVKYTATTITSTIVRRLAIRPQRSGALHSSALLCARARGSKPSSTSADDADPGETGETGSRQESRKTNPDSPKTPFNDPEFLRRMRWYMLVVGGTTFVISYIAIKPFFAQQYSIAADVDAAAKPLDMEQFLDVYIPSGEVKRIVYLPNQHRAVAWLHSGAIIGGKPANQQAVMIKYEPMDGRPVEHFRDEIRAKEKQLGINLQNGVPVEYYYGFTTWRVFELLLGLTILAFLATQYGRLVAARIAKQRTKNVS